MRLVAKLSTACLFAVLLLVPSLAHAQASLIGIVKDTSGAVLPGVTVEAASPALIEKVRTAVTDGSGSHVTSTCSAAVVVVTCAPRRPSRARTSSPTPRAR